MSTTREALEAALAADPDDVAAHAAYADLLIEAGDPRGEYIRLQLALEDRNQPADRLRAMEQEAFALRREHEAEWLGPLAEFVLPKRGPSVGAMVADNVEVTWRRGWVHGVRIERLTPKILRAVAGNPAGLLLQELAILRANLLGLSELRYNPVALALQSPTFRGLRRIELGSAETWSFLALDDEYLALIENTRCLRQLTVRASHLNTPRIFATPLPQLQTLELTVVEVGFAFRVLAINSTFGQLRNLHLDIFEYVEGMDNPHGPGVTNLIDSDELRIFFRSPHLRSLLYLGLRLPGFGDAGVDELISSGMIARLKGLDLCRCEITDDGAQELAACPDVARLEYLHLDNNLLSPVGIEALAAVGVTVSDRQLFGGWDAAGET